MTAPVARRSFVGRGHQRPCGQALRQRAFRAWLRKNRRIVTELDLPKIIAIYRGDISMSGAYHAAVAEGLRGTRRNGTRYAAFWGTINWRLPDSILSAVWGVSRGNIRQRRVRLDAGEPAYDGRLDRRNPEFLGETNREKRRAEKFDGARPR